MVDTLVLGTSGEIRGGSSPLSRTILGINYVYSVFCYTKNFIRLHYPSSSTKRRALALRLFVAPYIFAVGTKREL